MGHRKRLRQRFASSGLGAFADHEVLELLLTLAIPRRDVKPQAKALLKRFGNLRGVLDAPANATCQVPGLGEGAATSLQIVRHCAALYLQQKAEGQEALRAADVIKAFWRNRLGGLPNEVFEVAYLDNKGRVLRNGVQRLQEGTVDRASVYPRSVMEAALRHGAAGILVAHNHPGADPAPSEADKTLTRALVLAAETLWLKLTDHIIVGENDTFSFREAGLL